jgi:hypothetical protein
LGFIERSFQFGLSEQPPNDVAEKVVRPLFGIGEKLFEKLLLVVLPLELTTQGGPLERRASEFRFQLGAIDVVHVPVPFTCGLADREQGPDQERVAVKRGAFWGLPIGSAKRASWAWPNRPYLPKSASSTAQLSSAWPTHLRLLRCTEMKLATCSSLSTP